MSARPPRILISAPLLGLPEQVGLLRVQRTLRWLHGAGVETVVVAAGEPERTEPREMGCDVWIRSPAELLLSGTHPRAPHRRLAALRRRWRELRHLPDPGAKWAARAAKHPLVLEQIGDVQWAWSSSPPESAHLLAFHLRTAHPLRRFRESPP